MWTKQHEHFMRKLAADNFFQDVLDADIGPPKRLWKKNRLYPNLKCLHLQPYHVSDRYCLRVMKRMRERYQ
ncbi:hypothetical protein HaGV_gp088 [Helicoverpa armigera granulovirus]|uniref:Uncharacterized protein n=1 Tax=Helicoverpa armigera granulovirus TaxID=489830 RepID=A9YMT0_9BBAC|nr:hypothetical protein HaGV_gp088 [Helicoverpa armigera granulovirus]ABY47779.1 unknown [Helicoverpa armigera granulovirus]